MAGTGSFGVDRAAGDRELVSVPEAGRILGVQAQLIHYWTRVGKVEGFRIQGCVFRYVDIEDVRSFILRGNGGPSRAVAAAP